MEMETEEENLTVASPFKREKVCCGSWTLPIITGIAYIVIFGLAIGLMVGMNQANYAPWPCKFDPCKSYTVVNGECVVEKEAQNCCNHDSDCQTTNCTYVRCYYWECQYTLPIYDCTQNANCPNGTACHNCTCS